MLVWVVRLVLLLAGVGGGRGGVAHPVRGSVLLYFTLLTYYTLLGPHAGLVWGLAGLAINGNGNRKAVAWVGLG